MAGLDHIKRYEDGGNVNQTAVDEKPTSNLPTAPVAAKPVPAKGPYALPTPKGTTGVDEGILQRMQEIIAQREAQKGSFMEALRDAQAWWTGGVAGPSEALARRAKEREEFEATTFGMRRDLAQQRIAQERARRLAGEITGTPTTVPTTTGGAAAAGAPGAAPTINVPTNGMINLVRDPATKAVVLKEVAEDPDEAFKTIKSYVTKNAEDSQLIKDIRAGLAQGWLTEDMVKQLYPVRVAGGAETFKPFDVRGTAGTVQTTPLKAAATAFDRTPAPTTAAPAAPVSTAATTAPVAPVAAPTPTAAPSAVAPTITAPKPISQVTPLPKVGGAATTPSEPAPAAAPTEPPLVSANVPTGFAPGSKEDLAAREAMAKQAIETQAETQKPIAKQLGESIVATKNAASSAPDSILEYDMAESILKKYPKAFGIAQDGSATAAVIQLVKPGTTIPILGTIKAEGAEEALAQRRLSPEALAARKTFEGITKRKSVEFAQNNLTGEGRGTLSNADLKMSDVAKGLSIDSPAATNLIYTILNRENDVMMKERGDLIKKFESDARRKGVQPNYAVLKDSPEWEKTMADKDARIRKRFPEFFKQSEEAPKSEGTPKVRKYNPKTRTIE